MKQKIITVATAVFCLSLLAFQKKNSRTAWTQAQLMPPAELAGKINNGRLQNTVVFNIGPSGSIKNSIEIGPAQDEANLNALRTRLATIPKDREVVIYCGCCPFEHCPNIRPAFQLLQELKFSNAKLLDLPKNLKVDWIEKGYPLAD